MKRVNVRWDGDKGVLWTTYERLEGEDARYLGSLKKNKYGWYYYLPQCEPGPMDRGDLLGVGARMREANDEVESSRNRTAIPEDAP